MNEEQKEIRNQELLKIFQRKGDLNHIKNSLWIGIIAVNIFIVATKPESFSINFNINPILIALTAIGLMLFNLCYLRYSIEREIKRRKQKIRHIETTCENEQGHKEPPIWRKFNVFFKVIEWFAIGLTIIAIICVFVSVL